MILDFSKLEPKRIYAAMIQCIVPRPIAWVLSDNGNQTCNLAPFSYFSGVSSQPPLLSLAVGKKRDSSKKDTWVNIQERRHFVVHLAQSRQAVQVSATAASLPFGQSELDANRLAAATEPGWPLPRLEQAPIAMLCRRHQIIEVGETPQALILGRIERVYLDDAIIVPTDAKAPQIDIAKLKPLARLGGDDYTAIETAFNIARPA